MSIVLAAFSGEPTGVLCALTVIMDLVLPFFLDPNALKPSFICCLQFMVLDIHLQQSRSKKKNYQ